MRLIPTALTLVGIFMLSAAASPAHRDSHAVYFEYGPYWVKPICLRAPDGVVVTTHSYRRGRGGVWKLLHFGGCRNGRRP